MEKAADTPANRAFSGWVKSLPWGTRTERLRAIARATNRSIKTVRAWYSGNRAIPSEHAHVLEEQTGGAVGRQHWPLMWPEIADARGEAPVREISR